MRARPSALVYRQSGWAVCSTQASGHRHVRRDRWERRRPTNEASTGAGVGSCGYDRETRQHEVQSMPRRSEAKEASDARPPEMRLTRSRPEPARPGGIVARPRPECRGRGASDANYDQATGQDVVLEGSSAPLRSRPMIWYSELRDRGDEGPNDETAIVAKEAREVRGDL